MHRGCVTLVLHQILPVKYEAPGVLKCAWSLFKQQGERREYPVASLATAPPNRLLLNGQLRFPPVAQPQIQSWKEAMVWELIPVPAAPCHHGGTPRTLLQLSSHPTPAFCQSSYFGHNSLLDTEHWLMLPGAVA